MIISKMKNNLLLLATCLLMLPGQSIACFSGYFAPAFLDVTNPVIGVGIACLLIAVVVSYKRKISYMLVVLPITYIGISYYGHLNYSGDCGYEIVFLNKIAAVVAGIWLIYEITMYYRVNRKNLA